MQHRKNRRTIVNRLEPMINQPQILEALKQLAVSVQGDVHIDDVSRMIYSTDASVYQEKPLAVVCPRTDSDVQQVIRLANDFGIGLTPRAAGTSLAGQTVGSGIIVDVSRHMTKILEINPQERWVRVQPGVIRDELNMELANHGLLFGPETSTANRAMMGGMLGNNSCGSNSIVYGTTRDQTLQANGFLSDGTRVTLGEVQPGDLKYQHSCVQQTIELLSDPQTQERIRAGFPNPEVTRRNSGYAVDGMIETRFFGGDQGPLNLCQLVAGSEGTLFFATEIKLRCHPLPPAESGLFCPHFASMEQALKATQIVMRHQSAGKRIFACELIDRLVLDGAARNIQQQGNMRFVEGTPEAILVVDMRADNRESINALATILRSELQASELGYHHPVFFGDDVSSIWQLRKAGLGVAASMQGDAKPVALIEDVAVSVDDLPDYIREVDQLLESEHAIECVHYAHAGAGEIHLRPVLNLKTAEGVRQFRSIGTEVAQIAKKYRGSLSGEHGDGRVRSEFLPDAIGPENYELLRQIKRIWDPKNIFNPGKIVDATAMDEHLRYGAGSPTREVATVLSFDDVGGIQRAAEMCNGSGDCRKTELTGGVMCPSYMATREEKDTTRARANVLRQVLTNATGDNPLADERLKEVLDLCLACKGCKFECPSNVDMAKMKAEFLYQYHKKHGVSRRAKFIADVANLNRKASRFSGISNKLTSGKLTSGLLKKSLGIHPNRTLPQVCKTTLRKWFEKRKPQENAGTSGSVFFFCDEFTNFVDVPVGIAAIELLERLGFKVVIPNHAESGRAAISQGLLDQGKDCANKNVSTFSKLLSDECLLVGVEPSAVLTFRDEYPALVDGSLREQARSVSGRTLLIDEFISRLIETSAVSSDLFTSESRAIRLHGHCHQKALASMRDTIRMLQLPRNYQVKLIPAGCCGMAGSFGYEQEHYEVSMKIGELVLFPAIRKESAETIIAAGGTSCRHQILDGTARSSLHPVQILRDALK